MKPSPKQRTRRFSARLVTTLLCLTTPLGLVQGRSWASQPAGDPSAPSLDDSTSPPFHTLSNGLRVVILRDTDLTDILFTVHIASGVEHESAQEQGLAHFWAHHRFQSATSTVEHSTWQAPESFVHNPSLFDAISYSHRVPITHLPMTLWAEAKKLTDPKLHPNELDATKSTLLAEKLSVDAYPFSSGLDDFRRALFASTDYDAPVIGSAELLKKLGRTAATEFAQSHLNPTSTVWILRGPFTEQETRQPSIDKFERLFVPNKAQETTPSKSHSHASKQTGPDITHNPATAPGTSLDKPRVVTDEHTNSNQLIWGWRTVGVEHPDCAALDVLGRILFNSSWGRIPTALRSDPELRALGIQSPGGGHSWVFESSGAMVFLATPPPRLKGPGHLTSINVQMQAQIQKLIDGGVADWEVERATAEFGGALDEIQFIPALNDPLMARGLAVRGDTDEVFRRLTAYKKLNTSDIQRVAREYLSPKPTYFSFTGTAPIKAKPTP